MASPSTYPSVRHLVCFAGPPCCGKTFAMRKLQQGDNAQLSAILGIPDPEDWLAFAPGWLPPACPEELDRAFFHYDFLRTWKFGDENGQFETDRALRILGECEIIEFVTLLTKAETLKSRFSARPMLRKMIGTISRPGALVSMMVCYVRIRKLYKNPDRLAALYAEWIDFASQFSPRAHYVVESSDGYSVVNVENIPDYLTSPKAVTEKTFQA